MKAARTFAILCAVLFASNAAAQSYPSRPTFLSAGVGCNPNLFAQNIIGMTTNGFLCIGGYPNASGGAGQIYILSGELGNNPAQIYASDLANGNDGLSFWANNGASIITLGDQLIDIDGGDQISLTSLRALFGRGGDASLQFIYNGISDPSTTATIGYNSIANSVGTATYSLNTFLEMGGPFGVLENVYTVNYTEADGVINSFALNAPAIDFTGVLSLLGSSDLVMTSGDISDSNGAVVVNDDFSATGDATFGDDVAITDELTVGGAITVGSCSGCATGGATYGGYSDSAATAENVPTGWSVAVVGFVYTVTHNLGLGSGLDLAVACSAAQVTQELACQTDAHGANSFAISIVADGDTLTNAEFMFTAVIVDN